MYISNRTFLPSSMILLPFLMPRSDNVASGSSSDLPKKTKYEQVIVFHLPNRQMSVGLV